MRRLLMLLALAVPLLVAAQEDEPAADAPESVEGGKGTAITGQGMATGVSEMKPLGGRPAAQAPSGGGAAAGGGDAGKGVFGKGTCPGHSRTHWVEIDPKAVGLVYDTVRHGGIGTDGAVVVKLMTSSKPVPEAVQNVGIVEYPGTADLTTKRASISLKPCDFEGASAPRQLKTSGIDVSMTWAYGPRPAVKVGQMAALAPNTVYYLNVENVGCKPSSPGRTCDMRVETGAPEALRKALGWPEPEQPLRFQR